MNHLFDEEIRGHHSMRDHVLSLITDGDLDYEMPGSNPTLGGLLLEVGHLQGVYTHSFETFDLDWTHCRISTPDPLTVVGLKVWFAAQDAAMETALDRFTDEELRADRIDRGDGFVASPFVQCQVYRESVYISYGKLSVYLRAMERNAGPSWAAWVG